MKKLSYILKSSQFLYNIYFFVVSWLLKFLGLFIRVDDKLILFNSYGGKKYDDSPKAIYEWMLSDYRFNSCKLVWALQEPEKVSAPGRAEVIKADSVKYFVTALKARVWITNSSMERGLDFKKNKTICFNTWHGTPIKLMGIDIKNENQSFKSRVLVRADIMCAQSQYDIDTFSHAFRIPTTDFRMTGLARNDVLANYTADDAEAIRQKLGIGKDKTVLLYAPTFREYTKGSLNAVVLNVRMDLSKWQRLLGEKYVVLFRAHYEVARYMKVGGYPMFIDVSMYPNLNELMIASDALISDYSSIYFDYSVMHKPMYCFAYDYDAYMANRGMYLNLKEELPCTIYGEEEDLIKELLRIEDEKVDLIQRTIDFQKKYVIEYGRGAARSCDVISEVMLLS